MKLLITQDCAAPSMDGAAHLSANSVVEVEADVARGLVHAGRALYIDPKDDPSRIKASTAPEARVEAVRQALKAAAKSAKAEG
jgi:hypothetical protein